MSGSGGTLKAQNQKFLVAFVILNGIVFFGLIAGIAADWVVLSKQALGAAVISALVGALATILNGIIGGNAKAVLVFWRLKNPMPGARAFTRHMHADPRVNPDIIGTRHGPLPDGETEQNRLWYRLYQAHASAPSVLDAHGNYLLTRDLTVLSGLFVLTLGPAACVLAASGTFVLYYVLSLAVIFLIASQAARNYGVRLVTNVLAVESARPK